MRIVTVAYLHGSGGAERQITMLSNELVKRGHEVHMIVLAEFNKKYDIDDKVSIHDLTSFDKSSLHPIVSRYKALKKAYKDIKPDVVVHYNLQSAYLTAVMPRAYYHKSIYSERGDPYDDEYSGLLGKIRDWAVKRIDGFVFQSEGARDFFDKNIHKRSIVIHNSVNISVDKYPIPLERDNRIVCVGRLHPQKNHALLIEAFAKIANDFPNIILEIYGDGALREKLLNKIDKLGLTERIKLYPSRPDILNAIRTAQLFVLSSDYEGMPNALMEAMALGMPCISTDCRPGGARTLIEDGVNGFIVPRMDENALADKIRYVLLHPEVSDLISLNARSIVSTHTNEFIFNQWEQFLHNITII